MNGEQLNQIQNLLTPLIEMQATTNRNIEELKEDIAEIKQEIKDFKKENKENFRRLERRIDGMERSLDDTISKVDHLEEYRN
ncbi:MAG: hypothetical protein K0R28_2490 [Paenibacillus sp.]|nr:hypothetical protein [Paenibacillus sp.]